MAKSGTSFKPGQSGNPAGRPALAKAWEAATGGKKMADVTAEALRLVWERACQGPEANHFGDPNDPDWRFAMQKVLEYSAGKPKEVVEIHEGGTARREFNTDAMSVEDLRSALDAIRTLKSLAVMADVDGPTEH